MKKTKHYWKKLFKEANDIRAEWKRTRSFVGDWCNFSDFIDQDWYQYRVPVKKLYKQDSKE